MKRKACVVMFIFLITVLGLTGCDLSGFLEGEKGAVTGVVKNAQGELLPAVRVAVSNITVYTNLSGMFAINNLQVGDYILVASFNGYQTKQIDIHVNKGSTNQGEIILEKSIPTYALNITQIGNGTVTRTPSQLTYREGSTVTIEAVPEVGWDFVGWTGSLTGTKNPETVTMNGNKNITAIFGKRVTLNISIEGSGTVEKEPNQEFYGEGSKVKLTATPDPGMIFAHWEGDIRSSANPLTVTLNGSKNIKAVFTSTIQDAIVGALDGETIVVPPGTYHENIDFLGKAITLRSTNPNDPSVVAATILDGSKRKAVVTFSHKEGTTSVLTGFTVQNGVGTIVPEKADPMGGGICIYNNSSPTIAKNVITNNHAENGGAIYIECSSPDIIENNIINNSSNYMGGGINFDGPSSATIKNNIFKDNRTAVFGGAIMVLHSTLNATGNVFRNNQASFGAGIVTFNSGNNTVENNTFESNSVSGHGGAMYIVGGHVYVHKNSFSLNCAQKGGAITLHSDGQASVIENTFNTNSAQLNGGAIFVEQGGLLKAETGNIYKGNIPNDISG